MLCSLDVYCESVRYICAMVSHCEVARLEMMTQICYGTELCVDFVLRKKFRYFMDTLNFIKILAAQMWNTLYVRHS